LNLTAQAKLALGRGDVAQAKSFIEKANALRVPESEFGTGQLRPWQVAMEIDRAERQRSSASTAAPPTLTAPNASQPLPNAAATNPTNNLQRGAVLMPPTPGSVVTASASIPVPSNQTPNQTEVGPSVFLPKLDTTQVKPAAAMEQPAGPAKLASTGEDLYRNGVAALSAGDREQAIKLFTEAWKYEREMDALTRAQLKDKLTLLQGSKSPGKPSASRCPHLKRSWAQLRRFGSSPPMVCRIDSLLATSGAL
jgi:general secretion pathway protein D